MLFWDAKATSSLPATAAQVGVGGLTALTFFEGPSSTAAPLERPCHPTFTPPTSLPDALAEAAFQPGNGTRSGWAQLSVSTASGVSDRDQLEAAGVLEGYLTAFEIYAVRGDDLAVCMCDIWAAIRLDVTEYLWIRAHQDRLSLL